MSALDLDPQITTVMAVALITMALMAVAQTMANMGPLVGRTMARTTGSTTQALTTLARGPTTLAQGPTTLAQGPTTILSMAQARDQDQDVFVLAAIHVKAQQQVIHFQHVLKISLLSRGTRVSPRYLVTSSRFSAKACMLVIY